jgi:lipoprotein-anchoring transpeptidase ErfK/SrfK
MKVMRFNGTGRNRLRKGRRHPNTALRAAVTVAAVLVVLAAGVYAFIRFVLPALSNPTEQTAVPLQIAETEATEPVEVLRSGEALRMTLRAGEIQMLAVPSEVDIREVTFTSDNEAVLRVDAAGRVDALSPGTATITATAGDYTAACEVNVGEPAETKPLRERTTAIIANLDIMNANKAVSKDNLFNITVNRRTNTVTVYTYDADGNYTVPVRAMVCSCGKFDAENITPTGDFSIYFKEKWHPLYGDVYGQYVTGFEGSYLFHSVPYHTEKKGDLETEEFNKLGTNASMGCVRMMVSDVKWVYENCAMNTPVKVIDADASADPLGTPPTVKIAKDVKWDPTDPDEKNPFTDKTPEITGAEDITVKAGDAFDPMQGIGAKDICGNDITGRVKLTGEVIPDKAGVYYLTYSVKDPLRLKASVTCTVTVE